MVTPLLLLKKTLPDVGESNNAIICSNVDFPDPEGPVREIISPAFIFKFYTSVFCC